MPRNAIGIFAPSYNHTTRVEMVDPSVEKAARFLREVETEAEKTITKRVVFATRAFDADIVVYEQCRNRDTMNIETFVTFTVNGHQYKEHVKTSEWCADGRLAEIVFHQVATAITAQLMERVFIKHDWMIK